MFKATCSRDELPWEVPWCDPKQVNDKFNVLDVPASYDASTV